MRTLMHMLALKASRGASLNLILTFLQGGFDEKGPGSPCVELPI